MATQFLKLWRTLFPLRCDWCDFTSRTPQGMGKHRKRCRYAPGYEATT